MSQSDDVFDRAARTASLAFIANNWMWHRDGKLDVEVYLPTPADIVAELRRLEKTVREEGMRAISCGHLTAELDEDGDVSLYLDLGYISGGKR